ncbi:alpha/beta fold hydrolase [Nocardia aurantiaca]|uniref:Alpha/beta fold hydrolase n=1 Tax=Nocardia aurantiaca TaxID=2675850 RepID=A0A6I3L895_9NOCA|nr:alpha/beta fold hydrolase [Nocardia aurantiaca]MTE16964.1 alpha/beta fold hydrolase [Nocardia aurantiaca]
MRTEKLVCAVALTGILIACSAAISTPLATAEPLTEAAAADFYIPPVPLPNGGPGDIIRTESAQLALSAPGQPGIIPAMSTRVMYLSSDANDAPTAVVGTYLQPTQPWTGPGERPLVAYAGGTKGQGEQCAPSKLLSQLVEYQPPVDAIFEYDLIALYSLLSRGMAVVITDYHGLGTPDTHDYLNRKAQGYAVLDSARAATRLPGTGLSARTPVVLYGYSQGGMASAAAAELQPKYASDLNVRAAYVGGPVVDDEYFIGYNDGRPDVAPAIAWILNGITADYPDTRPVLDAELNDTGKAILRESADKCAGLFGLFERYQNTAQWTTSGQPLTAVIDGSPVLKAAFDEQRLGTRTPAVPVLISSARNDDGTPYPAIRGMAAGWCGGGASVQLNSNAELPAISGLVDTHVLAFFPSLATSQQWMTDRLAGLPAPVNCGALP